MPWIPIVSNVVVSELGTGIGPWWPSVINPIGFTILGPSGRGNKFDVLYSFPSLIAGEVKATFYARAGETYIWRENVIFPNGVNSLITGLRAHPSDVVWRMNARFWQ